MDLLRTISTPHPPPWAGIEPNQLNQPNEASTVTPTCCCYPVGVGSSVPFRSVLEAHSSGRRRPVQITNNNDKSQKLNLSLPLPSIPFDSTHHRHINQKKKKKTAAARRRLLLLRSTLTAAAAATPLLPSAATDLGWGARLLSPPR